MASDDWLPLSCRALLIGPCPPITDWLAPAFTIPMTQRPTPSFTIRQNELPLLTSEGRIGDYPVAVRTPREVAAGGFADHERHPNTWTVYFLVDGQWALVESARGLRREWSSLDRMEKWLRTFGFRFFWVRNDIEPIEIIEEGPLGGGPAMK